jgi:hypothetical protein
MSEKMSVNPPELYIALGFNEALNRLCDLLEENERLLSSRKGKATMTVLVALLKGEERPAIIRRVKEECGCEESYAEKLVDEIIGSLRDAKAINPQTLQLESCLQSVDERKGTWGKPYSRYRAVADAIQRRGREVGRMPRIYCLKPPAELFDLPEDLKRMVNLVLLLSGTAQRYLKIMVRISPRKEVLSSVCEIAQNQAYELLKQPLAKEVQEKIEKAIQGIEEKKKEIEKSDILDQLTPDQLRKVVDEVVDGWFQPILEPIYQQAAQMLHPSGPVNEESSKK